MFHAHISQTKAERSSCEQFLARWGQGAPLLQQTKYRLQSIGNNNALFVYGVQNGSIYGCIQILVRDSVYDIINMAIDPALRGQTLLSLLFREMYQEAQLQNIKFIRVSGLTLKTYLNELGFTEDRRHQGMILDLSHDTPLLSEVSVVHKNEGQPLFDRNLFWADFSDILTRHSQKRPDIFDGVAVNDQKLLLASLPRLQLNSGTEFKPEDQVGYRGAKLMQGMMGDCLVRRSGQHWTQLYRPRDSFSKAGYTPYADIQPILKVIQEAEIAIITDKILKEIKIHNPKLAVTLGMNILALEQHIEMDLEDMLPFMSSAHESIAVD